MRLAPFRTAEGGKTQGVENCVENRVENSRDVNSPPCTGRPQVDIHKVTARK